MAGEISEEEKQEHFKIMHFEAAIGLIQKTERIGFPAESVSPRIGPENKLFCEFSWKNAPR
jgi:hypothetical protein